MYREYIQDRLHIYLVIIFAHYLIDTFSGQWCHSNGLLFLPAITAVQFQLTIHTHTSSDFFYNGGGADFEGGKASHKTTDPLI